MKQDALANFDMPWLPISGLMIFVTCFFIYTWWTYKKSNKPFYDQASMLPLEEGAHEKK